MKILLFLVATTLGIAAPAVAAVLAPQTADSSVCTPPVTAGQVHVDPVCAPDVAVPGVGAQPIDSTGALRVNVTSVPTVQIAGAVDVNLPPVKASITSLPAIDVASLPAVNVSYVPPLTIASMPPQQFQVQFPNAMQVNGTLMLVQPPSPPAPVVIFRGKTDQQLTAQEQATFTPAQLLNYLGINLTSAQFSTCHVVALSFPAGGSSGGILKRQTLYQSSLGAVTITTDTWSQAIPGGNPGAPQTSGWDLANGTLSVNPTEMADLVQFTLTYQSNYPGSVEFRTACFNP